MAESANVELAHRIHERGEQERPHTRRREVAIEIAEAFLLALVAIATAWSGYQSALWDGRSAKLYGTSSRIRIEATQNETRGGQQQVYDATTFNFWLRAHLEGEPRVASQYERRFLPEYHRAFRAWLDTRPFTNPRSPPGPIYMPQYRNALLERAARKDRAAAAAFAAGAHARETGDKYVRTTVLLATVLFLIALSQRFGLVALRVGVLTVALVLLGVALASIAEYPRL